MKRPSFRLRLFAAGSISILLALGLATWGLTLLFAQSTERSALIDLSDQVESLAVAISVGPSGTVVMENGLPDPLYERPYSGHYWQIEIGDLTFRSRSLWDYELPLPTTASGQATLPGPEGERLLVVDRLLSTSNETQDVQMRIAVAMDRRELDLAEQAFLADLAPYLAILAFALLAANAIQVTVGLRPFAILGKRLQDLESQSSSRIGAEDLPVEVRPLAERIDQLIAAREAERDRARQRAGDLAHGLKTPLQALLGEARHLAGLGQTDAAGAIEQTVGQMQAHIDRELTRTRLAAASGAVCDAKEVALAVVSVLQRTPEGGSRTWLVSGCDPLPVKLDRVDLTEALGAMAENAARHADRTVEIRLAVDGQTARIAVIDDGPGVLLNDMARLLDRGVKLDERSGGTGLGLAIAAEIAVASGGNLTLRNCTPGFEATLVLPLARSAT